MRSTVALRPVFVLTCPSCYTIGPPKTMTVAISPCVAPRTQLSVVVATGDAAGPTTGPVFAGQP